jgi:hypothetical protein
MRQHAVEQRLGLDAAFFVLLAALPFGEMVPLAGDGAVASAMAVADNRRVKSASMRGRSGIFPAALSASMAALAS